VVVRRKPQCREPFLGVTKSARFLLRLLSLDCMDCRPNSRSLVLLLVCALALSCTVCPYLNTPGPVLASLTPGVQIEAALGLDFHGSTAGALGGQTRGAAKILAKSELPAIQTSAADYSPRNSGILISATPFIHPDSTCRLSLCGRSPPRMSST
jgi:hypothetical protein